MAAIDLIVLGMLKQRPLSAYDLQKLVEFRNISSWVKISTPSIYKKVLQLEEKGYLAGETVREGKMAEKTVYALTPAGEAEFQRLMLDLSDRPIHIFLDLNAVIVNLPGLPAGEREICLARIGEHARALRASLEENLNRKEPLPQVPETGLAVLRQQLVLAQAIETWLDSVRGSLQAPQGE